MGSYNVHEAESSLSQLLKRVEQGEEVTIGRDGEPVAKLVRFRPKRAKKIQLGVASKAVWAAPSWDRAMSDAEVEALFGGKL